MSRSDRNSLTFSTIPEKMVNSRVRFMVLLPKVSYCTSQNFSESLHPTTLQNSETSTFFALEVSFIAVWTWPHLPWSSHSHLTGASFIQGLPSTTELHHWSMEIDLCSNHSLLGCSCLKAVCNFLIDQPDVTLKLAMLWAGELTAESWEVQPKLFCDSKIVTSTTTKHTQDIKTTLCWFWLA